MAGNTWNSKGSPIFRPGELIAASWKCFSDNFALLFFGHLLANLIISTVAGPFLAGPLGYGVCAASLVAARKAPVKIDYFFSGFQRFLETFLVGMLLCCMALGVAILLAVPGIFCTIWAARTESVWIFSLVSSVSIVGMLVPTCAIAFFYTPTFFFMYDGMTDIWQAMAASRRLVWRDARQWLSLWAALSLLHVAGLLLCCVGVYVVTPWMVVALALAYDKARIYYDEAPGIPSEKSE